MRKLRVLLILALICVAVCAALFPADAAYAESGKDEIGDGIILWVESGDNSFCLFVDKLIGEQQVVVKPLPDYVNNYGIRNYGVTGCTILGNGDISIILDVASIYTASQAG